MAGGLVGAPLKRALQFTVNVPAGTAQNAPQTTQLPIPDSWVYEIEVQVPDGPAGLMGFCLTYANTPIIPWANSLTFLTVENYEKTFPVEAQMGKGLACVAFNNGDWPHLIFLRVLTTPISAYQAVSNLAPVQAIDFSSMNQGSDIGDVQSA